MTAVCDSVQLGKQVFAPAAKVKSRFLGPTDTFGQNTADVPSRFAAADSPGRSAFIAWANMPEITYSADPNTLYNMQKLGESFRSNECVVNNAIAAQQMEGIKYPTSFYVGIGLGSLAVLYALIRR